MLLKEESIEELRDRLTSELHILVIMISSSWSGLEQTSLADTRLLEQNGLKVTVLIREGSPMDEKISMESPHIRRVYAPEKVRNYLDGALLKQIRFLIDHEGVNLIHCHQTSVLGSVAPALVRRNHVALVVSRHILNNHNKRDPVHALLYRRVDYILVLSKTMRRNLAATFPVPEKKLRIVNLAIDLNYFNPSLVSGRKSFREEMKIPENAFLVGVVGRLDPMKGQDLVIKALAQVCKNNPHAYAIIVGDETPGLDGEYINEMRNSIEQLRLGDRIFVSKARQDIPYVLSSFDLFLMPSWSEAFGLAALEAMAMGVPCILSRSGSAEELAYASGSELFRPRDAYDLARKITYLYNSPEIRKQIAEQGIKFVQQEHSKPKRLHDTLEVYARCYRRRIAAQED